MTEINSLVRCVSYDFFMQTAIQMNDSDGDQGIVVDFLGDPATHGDPPDGVRRVETHGAIVFLAGDRAFKMKKAVRFPYLDFSSLDKRRRACEREYELNRPHAPEIYLGVEPVTRRPDGALAIGGDGDPVEWLVVMRRFPERAVLATAGKLESLDGAFLDALADSVARLHAEAVAGPRDGGATRFRDVVEGVLASLIDAADLVEPAQARTLAAAMRRAMDETRRVLDFRARTGFVRRCHGDLHLRNIVDFAGDPLPFDALEFDEELATTDTLYDLAYLLMDIDERGHRPAANRIFNRYLAATGASANYCGLAALPAFIACRAAIRVRVMVDRAHQTPDAEADALRAEIGRLMAYANDALKSREPMLIGIGGLSGSGKTTLARELAPRLGRLPGAVLLRSDLERKTLFGVEETRRLGDDAYTADANRQVYARLYRKAKLCLHAGQSVIVDAVHQREAERDALARVADEAGVPFVGYWLAADEDTLVHRVAIRTRSGADASDATADVVRKQLERPVGPMPWVTVDAAGALEHTLRSVLLTLKPAYPDAVTEPDR